MQYTLSFVTLELCIWCVTLAMMFILLYKIRRGTNHIVDIGINTSAKIKSLHERFADVEQWSTRAARDMEQALSDVLKSQAPKPMNKT